MLEPAPITGSSVQNMDIPQAVRDYQYQDGDCLVLPYNHATRDHFPEAFLPSMYFRMKEEGLLPLVFPQAEPLHLNHVVQYLADKPILVVFKKPEYTVAGLGWLYQVEGPEGARKGSVGFAFFREFQGRHLARQAARLALRWWMTEGKIDAIFGTVAVHNRIAENFARRVGFNVVGTIPYWFATPEKKFMAARLMLVTKEDFEREAALWDQASAVASRTANSG